MGEPELEDISDYNELKGSKKRVVWGVIFGGILMSIIYVYIANTYGNVKDSIKAEDSVKYMPLK